MSVYKQPTSAVWWCEFHVAGVRHRRSTGKTDRAEAKREERRLRSEAEQNAPVKRRGVGTLTDLGAEDVERATNAGGDPTWVVRVESLWAILLAHLGASTDPLNLTAEDLNDYVTARRAKKIRGQTIRKELQALLRGLKSARAKGWISKIPEPWPVVKSDPKSVKQAGKLHSAEVIAEVIKALPPMAVDGVRFAAMTGVRLHELQRVRASFVRRLPTGSPVAAVLCLPPASTKGRKPRSLGLNADALAIVDRRMVAGDLLFGKYGFGLALRRAAKKLKLPTVVTMRDLRHAYASNALKASGGNLAAVSEALGHSELETTTIYLHAEQADVLGLGAIIPIPVSPYSQAFLSIQRDLSSNFKALKVESKGIEPSTSGLQSRQVLDNVGQLSPDEVKNVQGFVVPSSPFPHTKSPYEIDLSFPEPMSLRELLAEYPRSLGEYPRLHVHCESCGRVADVEEGPGIWECIYCGKAARVEV